MLPSSKLESAVRTLLHDRGTITRSDVIFLEEIRELAYSGTAWARLKFVVVVADDDAGVALAEHHAGVALRAADEIAC